MCTRMTTDLATKGNDMATATLQFWFEFASTYSYLSASRISELAKKAQIDVEWRPFMLGPIFHAQGWSDSPFNIYPAKGKYMWRDMERLCKARNLPLVPPDPFPQHTVLAARTALIALERPEGADFCRAVYDAEFVEGKSVSDREVLAECLEKTGLPVELLDQAVTDPVKQRMRGQVDTAVKLGIFGAPSFVVNNELFWGDDRLEDAIDWAVNHVQ